MATPISIGVPALRVGQTIPSWRPLFEAAVSTLLQGEGGYKAAISFLPAYVNRGKMECTLILRTLGMDSLEEAFTYLIEHLDPEVDEYAVAESFRSMTWPPGELVTDFLARYLEEGKAVQLQPKQICRFMITESPEETQKDERWQYMFCFGLSPPERGYKLRWI